MNDFKEKVASLSNKKPLGLGTAALGRPGYINLTHGEDLGSSRSQEDLKRQTHRILDLAWEKGIRYFDTARSYGLGEQFLGTWLRSRNVPRDQVVVASKWGYTYTAGWSIQAEKHEIKDHGLDQLNRQIQETRENLGDYLDLYQIHSATLESGVLSNTSVLDRLWDLKDSEPLAIGLSLSGPNQDQTLMKAMSIRNGKRLLFDSVQATWNLLEPSAEGALMRAEQEGLVLIVKEALANGRLATDDFLDQDKDLLEAMRTCLGDLKTPLSTVALAMAIRASWSTIVLSGAASSEHLESNLSAVELELPAHLVEQLRALSQEPEEYWAIRSTLPWK